MTKDKTSQWKLFLCCGIFIWFIINLLQGLFVEIYEDEAYYALYGEHLAWGYFDHPPMVGLMTFLSSKLLNGILGVRLLTIVCSTLTLLVLWRLLDDASPSTKKVSVFLVLACSVTMFNIYGFVTTPDAALILFSALLLLAYQSYLKSPTWPKALLMGVLMACLVYSKYHAILLLGLLVLSNLKLLKDGKFYVACMLAVLLLIPHIAWQVQAGFPSVSYHLMQRGEAFRWSYFWEYLPNQLLVFNPFSFGAMVYVLLRHRAADRFERALRFIFTGFILFFWLMAFRGHVEPHWTIIGVIPMVVLLYRKCCVDAKLMKYVKWFVTPSLLLIVLMRVGMMTPLAKSTGFYGKKPYYEAVASLAGDSPVVFQGSFQKPALYHFFSKGKPSATERSYYDRKTQFDIWQFEKQWIGQRVFVIAPESSLRQTYSVNGLDIEGFFVEHFQTANRLVSDFTFTNAEWQDNRPVYHPGDTIRIDFSIHNPYDQVVDFHHEQLAIGLKLLLMDTGDWLSCGYRNPDTIAPHETVQGRLYAVVGNEIKTGNNRLALVLSDHIASCISLENVQEISVLQ